MNMALKYLSGVFCVAMVCSTVQAAHTGTIDIASTNLVGGVASSLALSFGNHAHETNGLWVAFGQAGSETTNGWDCVRFLATVPPAMDSYTFDLPAGWGSETLCAVRFFLSEVPYEVDCTLSDLRSDKASGSVVQGMALKDFTLTGADRVQTRVSFDTIKPGRAQGVFCARPGDGTAKAPYFNVFLLDGGKFRLDYNASTVGSSKTRAANTFYDLDVSRDGGLVVNGETDVAAPVASRWFDTAASGTPFLFCGKTTAVSSAAKMKMAYFRVLSFTGEVRLDLVPVLKGGEPVFYDVVGKRFYSSLTGVSGCQPLSAGERVESADPFFASVGYQVPKPTGTTVFATPVPLALASNYVNPEGGILLGPAPLTLTGQNDFGGRFTVSNGTLVAAFGQGLGATDNLLLAGGAYCSPDGTVTTSLGTAGGQIAFDEQTHGGFSAVKGNLTVNLGGTGAPLTYAGAPRVLILNDESATGTLRVENPIALTATISITNSAAPAVLTAPITGDRRSNSLYTWGEDQGAGQLVFAANNSFMTFYQRGGNSVFPAGTTNILGGNFYVEGGTLLMTNTVLKLQNEATLANGFRVYRGETSVYDSELSCRQMVVGQNKNQPTVNAGTVKFVASTVEVKGELDIEKSSGSAALDLRGGSRMTVTGKSSLKQRNIYVRDSFLKLAQGLDFDGDGGTARCTVFAGGVLETKTLRRVDKEPYQRNCEIVFHGGTIRQISASETFCDGLTSIYVVGSTGGVFDSAFGTRFSSPLVLASSSLGYSNAWNYSPADYLTAPAFVKTGEGTLTISGTNTYTCATAVEGGTLALSEEAKLPASTVVRLGGGTLDLGGTEQTVRAVVSTGMVGCVSNGALTVTDGICPGGVGQVGTLNVAATLNGTFLCDVRANGTCDCINATGTLDLSTVDLVLGEGSAFPAGAQARSLQIVKGATTGSFRTVPHLPANWNVFVRPSGVFLSRSGLVIIVR
ncbi:MAG: autotransporter-associated beta strand repeat-containing protein [bacterium]|nr:autotransporter-associated beta strand repeat-containing protein [bacterium]